MSDLRIQIHVSIPAQLLSNYGVEVEEGSPIIYLDKDGGQGGEDAALLKSWKSWEVTPH